MKADQEQPPERPEDGTASERKPAFNSKALLQSNFDFDGLGRKLIELSEAHHHGKSPVTQILDKIETALIHARKAGMTISQLHLFLVANGVRVSKPTLRAYLAGKRVKTPRKMTGKPRNKETLPTAPPPAENQTSTSEKARVPAPRGRMK